MLIHNEYCHLLQPYHNFWMLWTVYLYFFIMTVTLGYERKPYVNFRAPPGKYQNDLHARVLCCARNLINFVFTMKICLCCGDECNLSFPRRQEANYWII